MVDGAYHRYGRLVYNLRAEALYYHRLAGAIGRRWQMWATMSALLTAITSSTSAVAGWALWEQPGGREVWITIAGIAALVSIVNGVLEVARKVKDRESLRSGFRAIIFDAETFLDDLLHGMQLVEAKNAYDALKKRHADHVDRHEGLGWDVVETARLRAEIDADVQKQLTLEAEALTRDAEAGGAQDDADTSGQTR